MGGGGGGAAELGVEGGRGEADIRYLSVIIYKNERVCVREARRTQERKSAVMRTRAENNCGELYSCGGRGRARAI